MNLILEAVFTGEVLRMGEQKRRQSRQIFVGILYVFQENLTQSGSVFAVQMVCGACEYSFLEKLLRANWRFGRMCRRRCRGDERTILEWTTR